jgi:Concanavalin A-like lectin/glucanases superfamily
MPGFAVDANKPGWPLLLNRDSDQAQGLVGYWPMVSAGGGNLWDLSVKKYVGAINGTVVWGRGNGGGKCLVYDGVGVRVNCGNVLDQSSGSFSYGAWVNYSGNVTQNTPSIMGKQATSNTLTGYNLNLLKSNGSPANSIKANVSDGTTSVGVAALQANNDGKWHLALVTVDRIANLLTLYVDGISQGTASTAAIVGSMSNTNPLSFGYRYDGLGAGDSANYLLGSTEGHLFYNYAVPASIAWSLYAPPTRWQLRWQPGRRTWFFGKPATGGLLLRRRRTVVHA